MQNQITPGDWSVYRLSPDSDKHERLIVTTKDSDTEICGIVENEADAHLIAAAPKHLEMLQRIDRIFGEWNESGALSVMEDSLWHQIKHLLETIDSNVMTAS